jgi:dihydropteroate synthase
METSYAPTTWARHTLDWGQRTHIMGILNITPDSFSRDGLLLSDMSPEQVVRHAVERATAMVTDGADIIDVGGESTRPATVEQSPLPASEERRRVIPVIRALASALTKKTIISIDTCKAEVAAAALDTGAHLVNDVTGLRGDPEMASLVAERKVPVVIMSNLRGERRQDPLSDVLRQLGQGIDRALAAGVPWDHIILDPGFGFGLTSDENLRVMAGLSSLRALGRPLLIGTSRKSHIGMVLGTPVEDRLEGTAATVALCIAYGADIVRVHDVRQMVRVARMTDAVVRGWRPRES